MRCASHDRPRLEPFGPTTRNRQIAAACVVMAGAIPAAIVAASHKPPLQPRLYLVVLTVGIVGTIGWLVDGRRYLGAGLGALGLGTALLLVRETAVDPYFLLFGLVGVALLVVSKINPFATPGTAGLLLIVGLASRSVAHGGWSPLPKPATYALIMLIWGGSQLRTILRPKPGQPESEPEPVVLKTT